MQDGIKTVLINAKEIVNNINNPSFHTNSSHVGLSQCLLIDQTDCDILPS